MHQPQNDVGTTGFEPATSRTPSERSTKLSHIPMLHSKKQRPLATHPGFSPGQSLVRLYFFESRWSDSNRRSPGPKPGAISRLRYTSMHTA